MLHQQLQTLESEIQRCEVRIRLHDVRTRDAVRLLRRKAREAVNGKTLALAGGLAGAAAAAWGWSRTHPRHNEPPPAMADGHQRRRRDWVALAQRWMPLLLPVLSPLLNRKLAVTLAGLGLPVRPRPLPPLPTVPQLDLARYAGLWHEIARLPLQVESQCARNATTTYVMGGGGYEVINRCLRDDGEASEVRGRVRQPDPARPGQLEVSFAPPAWRWWPAAWADYWVLFVDDAYQVALVGTPDRDALSILARDTTLPEADLEALKSLALRHGFDVSRLTHTPHTEVVPEPS